MHDDHVMLRRYMIDFGILERDPRGTSYRLAAPVERLPQGPRHRGVAAARPLAARRQHARRPRPTAFPRRPRMAAGDRLLLYASGWRCVFGVAEVLDEPSTDAPSPADPRAGRGRSPSSC